MNHTTIEWVKNPDGTQGYTWNPITGCLNGCPYCYARKLANGRLKSRYLSNPNLPLHALPYSTKRGDPFYPRFWPDRLEDIWDGNRTWSLQRGYSSRLNRDPRGIFVCNMGELFGPWLPRQWQDKVFEKIRERSRDRFYLLTKQPQNLVPWSPFPDNCWVGVTATDMEQYKRALVWLAVIDAKVKYISFEPLLEHIPIGGSYSFGKDIGWLIIGAQTKPYKAPKLEWVEEIVMAADEAGVKAFLKDSLAPALKVHEPFIETTKNYTRYPRQEMPEPEQVVV